ncbi:MAG: hypothetical protein ACTSRG_20220 [Candidatus Helarchaeota archaeon]
MNILKEGIDFHELTAEELNEKRIPLPDEPDTETGKYVLLSITGILKMCPRIFICNNLWIHFIECLNLEIGNEKFIRSNEYITTLIKAKYNSKFEPFKRIIEIALDNPDLLLKYKTNLYEFMEFAESFGREYGFYNVIKNTEEKQLESLIDVYFTILNKFSETIKVI